MAFLPLFRLVALSVVCLFSIIVLGLSAHLTSLTETYFDAYFTYAAMSIATAILSMLTLPTMIIIEMMRKGAFTSLVMVELGWIGILWVLWLTSAALAAEGNSLSFISGCGYYYEEVSGACKEGNAIEAFNFLNWIILMAYFTTVLVFALIAVNKGNTAVWNSTVAEMRDETNFSEKPNTEFAPNMTGGSNYPPSSPPSSGWAGQPATQPSYHPQV